MKTRRTIALAGALLLLPAVFAPIIYVPIAGGRSYIGFGVIEGGVVLILAIACAFWVFRYEFKMAFWGGMCTLAVLALTFTRLGVRTARLLHKLEGRQAELAGNPYGEPVSWLLEETARQVSFRWGWLPLAVGASLVVASTWRVRNSSTRSN